MPATNISSAYTNTGVTIGSRPERGDEEPSRPIASRAARGRRADAEDDQRRGPNRGAASRVGRTVSSAPAARSGMVQRYAADGTRKRAATARAIQTGSVTLHATSGWRRPCARAGSHAAGAADGPADERAGRHAAARTGDRAARTTDGRPRGPRAAPTSHRHGREDSTTPIADQTNVSIQRSSPASRTAAAVTRTQASDAEQRARQSTRTAGGRGRRPAGCLPAMSKKVPPIRSSAA